MTPAHREWLPRDAITCARVLLACAPMLGEWQRRWFAGEQPDLSLKPSSSAPGRMEWVALYDSPALRISVADREPLYTTLVGALVGGAERSDADHALLDAAVAAAVRDLGEVLAAGASSRDRVVGDLHQFDLCLPTGRVLLRLSMSEGLLAILVRSKVASHRPVFRPRSLRSALSCSSVAVSAELGSAELEMGELKALAIGDVIVLETPLGATVELHLGDGPALVARGVLAETPEHNSLKITG